MIIKHTPAGLVGYITRSDFERAEQYARRAAELEALADAVIREAGEQSARQDPGRFRVLLNHAAGENSKTAGVGRFPQAHALGARAREAGPFPISENITLQK